MSAAAALSLFLWSVVVVVIAFAITDGMRVRRIRRPEFVYEQLGEDSMSDILTYAIVAAPVVDGDVVTREFTVTVDGVARDPELYGAGVTDFGRVSVPQDSSVTLSLVDIDDAGNRSEPAVTEFVAVDTVAPAMPGAISVTLVGETTDTPEVDG